jgi:hypothetical protein
LIRDNDVFSESHPLTGYTPSIEEFMLRQCQTVSAQEWAAPAAIKEKGTAATPEEERFVQGIWAKFGASNRCEEGEFIKMQKDAFRREFSSSKPVTDLSGLSLPDAPKEEKRTPKFDTSNLPDQPKQEKKAPKAVGGPQGNPTNNPFDDLIPDK